MTEERNTKDTGAETDAVVTRAYRDTAHERAPESLNRGVLDRAAKAARPRYSRLILWTRPMAWAATAMLSVAIVLQLTQAPAPETGRFDDSIRETEVPADVPTEQLEEAIPAASAPKIEALRSSTKRVAPGAEQSKLSFADQDLATTEDELKLKSQDMLQRSNDMARMREGDAPQAAAAASEMPQVESANVATLGAASAIVAPRGCDENATAAAEAWLQCITALEEAGLNDVASEERKLLAAAFPDFDTP